MGEATYIVHHRLIQPEISIHASRGGSDIRRYSIWKLYDYFNPRFPWGKRPNTAPPCGSMETFQSTLPVGEATAALFHKYAGRTISIHASRGGSDVIPSLMLLRTLVFQSTLPVGEATNDNSTRGSSKAFQSTLPVGEATLFARLQLSARGISIHASRGGSDQWNVHIKNSNRISIHASRGGSDRSGG